MTGPLIYPGADTRSQWVGKGSVTMPMDDVKWGVHDTETASWPSYSYGGISMGSAPTLTYNPWTHQMRQHFEMNQSARAFRNGPSGQYVNRVDVVQMEVIGYCDYNLSKKYGHAVSDIDDRAVNDLGEFGAWMHEHWGLALLFYPAALPWPAYPKGCTRMSWEKYVTWSGVLGHMAVPYNSHLDPGDLPMDRIAAVMKAGGKVETPWPDFRDRGPAVRQMQRKLKANGYPTGKDAWAYYGAGTKAAIVRLQRAQGWSGSDADGLIGPATWALIEAMDDGTDQPPPPPDKPDRLWPILDDPREAIGDAIRALEPVTVAHPKWRFGTDMLTRWQADWRQLKDIQTPDK